MNKKILSCGGVLAPVDLEAGGLFEEQFLDSFRLVRLTVTASRGKFDLGRRLVANSRAGFEDADRRWCRCPSASNQNTGAVAGHGFC